MVESVVGGNASPNVERKADRVLPILYNRGTLPDINREEKRPMNVCLIAQHYITV